MESVFAHQLLDDFLPQLCCGCLSVHQPDPDLPASDDARSACILAGLCRPGKFSPDVADGEIGVAIFSAAA